MTFTAWLDIVEKRKWWGCNIPSLPADLNARRRFIAYDLYRKWATVRAGGESELQAHVVDETGEHCHVVFLDDVRRAQDALSRLASEAIGREKETSVLVLYRSSEEAGKEAAKEVAARCDESHLTVLLFDMRLIGVELSRDGERVRPPFLPTAKEAWIDALRRQIAAAEKDLRKPTLTREERRRTEATRDEMQERMNAWLFCAQLPSFLVDDPENLLLGCRPGDLFRSVRRGEVEFRRVTTTTTE